MRIEEIVPGHVVVPPRLRAVDNAKVKSLADSMKGIGLQQPITVWAEPDKDIHLVAGAHRLEAAKSLGWEWIDAVFTDANEIDRQLWEIDENLIRSELTATQQAEHLAKRRELWEARRESGTSCPTLTGRGNKQFAAETSDKTGVPKRTVNRAVSRAEGVTKEVRDTIRGTDLDKGVVLDKLKKLPADEQMPAVEQFKSTQNVIEDPDEKQFDALKSAWNRASTEARRRFELWVYG